MTFPRDDRTRTAPHGDPLRRTGARPEASPDPRDLLNIRKRISLGWTYTADAVHTFMHEDGRRVVLIGGEIYPDPRGAK